jgi:hypothetical protein
MPADNAHVIGRHLHRRWDRYQLLQPQGGDELILELQNWRPDGRSISIINGASGQLVQTIKFPAESLRCVMQNPVTNIVAIMSAPTLSQKHPALDRYYLIFVQRFSCSSGGVLSPLPIDAVFTPRAPRSASNSHFRKAAIHPFTMAAISCSPVRGGQDPILSRYVHWEVWGQSLKPITDKSLDDLVQREIKVHFSPDPPAMGQCFLAEDCERFTLRQRAELRRHGRRELLLSKSWRVDEAFFLGERLFLGQSVLKYVLDF